MPARPFSPTWYFSSCTIRWGAAGAFGGLLRQNLAGILPNVVCTIPLGLLVSLVLQRRSGLLLLVLFMAPLLLARYSFKLYLDSRSLHIRTVACLSEAIEAKDPYTRGHSRRVAYYSEQIARALRLPGGTVYQIKVAALLHDVGKIGIDDASAQARRFDRRRVRPGQAPPGGGPAHHRQHPPALHRDRRGAVPSSPVRRRRLSRRGPAPGNRAPPFWRWPISTP